MLSFDKRLALFEGQYKHDRQRQFALLVRCARQLALWAAKQQRLSDDEMQNTYVETLVDDVFVRYGVPGLVMRVHEDLKAVNSTIDDRAIEHRFIRLLDEVALAKTDTAE